MKLPVFPLLVACLLLHTNGYGQKLNLTEKNATLERIFGEVEKQAGYTFFYKAGLLKNAGKITIDVKQADIDEVMAICLKGLPLQYTIVAKTVMIIDKPALASSATTPAKQTRGMVIDSSGRGLADASVVVKGTKTGVSTDKDGRFLLDGIGPGDEIIVSYAGFAAQEIKISNFNNVIVILAPSTSPLDAVQIIAYGTTTKRFNVGSVSTVTADDIKKQPVSNALQALQGRVAGLMVNNTSGVPGAAVKLQIRGQNTLNSIGTADLPFDQPLYIVDGVPFAPQNQNTSTNLNLGVGGRPSYNDQNISGTGGLSPFNSINPADIEQIDVLRDAEATSIYGSQGANGVILITTKKGKKGPLSLNINITDGASVATRTPQMMNTRQYLALRKEAMANDGLSNVLLPPASTDIGNMRTYPDLLVYNSTEYHNWADDFLGGTARNFNAHASLSGGTDLSNFIISGGYTRNTYNFPGGFANTRVSTSAAFHHNSPDRRFAVDFTASFSSDKNDATGSPSALDAFLLPPNRPALLDENGQLVWSYNNFPTGDNPLAFLKRAANILSYNLNNSLTISYRILPGLTFKQSFGYSKFNTVQYKSVPLVSIKPGDGTQASASFGNSDQQSIIIEPQLNYNSNLGFAKLDVLIGGTFRKNTSSSNTMNGAGYISDELLGSIGGASVITGSTSATEYKYAAVFGRVGFNRDGKYLLNLSARRDGSSNFGPGRQFGNFAAVGAGWIFSQEDFFKKAFPFISFGKLRGSYGTTGTDGVAPYRYQPNWTSVSPISSSPFQGIRGLIPTNLFNSDYSWAVNKKLDLGLDLGFLKDRILLGVSVYQNRCGNQLTQYTLPIQTGFGSVTANLPALVQNKGLEISLNTTNIRTSSFTWSSSFNISFQNNKLLEFPDLELSPYANNYFIGMPVNTRIGAKYAGLDSATGAYRFLDGKGNYTISPQFTTLVANGGDGYFLPNTTPEFFGGLNNNFTYKNLGLSFFLQFNKQLGQNYLYNIFGFGTGPGGMYNQPVDIIGKYWQKPGDQKVLSRPTTNTSFNSFLVSIANNSFPNSDVVYSDASYIRLQNVAFYYALPARLLKRVWIKNCRINVNIQNLLTFTNYELGDPETRTLYGIPPQRTIVAGLSFGF